MVKTAVILVPDDNGTQPLYGIPAVRRLALLKLKLGFEAIHVIGRTALLGTILSDLIPADRFHPLEDPALLEETVEDLSLPEKERVLVSKANLVIDIHSLDQLLKSANNSGIYFMPAEGNNAVDGLYLTGAGHVGAVARALWMQQPARSEVLPGAQRIDGFGGLPCLVGKNENWRKASENRLTAALSLHTGAQDSFLSRHFDRYVSRFISERLAHTGLSPNSITICGAAIGLLGAFLLSSAGYWPRLAGSLLFVLCVIVDGVDGEVARLKLQETPFGHYLDVITDNLVHVAVFVGIAFGLYRQTGDVIYLQALWFLLGGFGLCAVVVYWCILRRSAEELENSSLLVRLMSMLTNRDFAYLVVALAAVQRLNWFLLGAAVGTYLFAATLWGVSLYEKRATRR